MNGFQILPFSISRLFVVHTYWHRLHDFLMIYHTPAPLLQGKQACIKMIIKKKSLILVIYSLLLSCANDPLSSEY